MESHSTSISPRSQNDRRRKNNEGGGGVITGDVDGRKYEKRKSRALALYLAIDT